MQDQGDGWRESAESRSRMRLRRRAVMLEGFKYACAAVASLGRRKKARTTEKAHAAPQKGFMTDLVFGRVQGVRFFGGVPHYDFHSVRLTACVTGKWAGVDSV